jgi:hypothetical protein
MGSSALPSAMILAPGSMTSVPSVPWSPMRVVPGSMVSLAGALTYVMPSMSQHLSAVRVRSALISAGSDSVGPPGHLAAVLVIVEPPEPPPP